MRLRRFVGAGLRSSARSPSRTAASLRLQPGSHRHLPQPLLGVLTGGNGYIAILLSPLAGVTLCRQLVLQVAKCLVLSHPLVGQLGLKLGLFNALN